MQVSDIAEIEKDLKQREVGEDNLSAFLHSLFSSLNVLSNSVAPSVAENEPSYVTSPSADVSTFSVSTTNICLRFPLRVDLLRLSASPDPPSPASVLHHVE